MPLDERGPERTRNFLGEHRLAGAGFALDQQRPLERDRGVDREHQIRCGDVSFGAFATAVGHRGFWRALGDAVDEWIR